MNVGYIYRTTIHDNESNLDNCYYCGKRQKSKFDTNYFGSGKILKDYIKAKGTKNLEVVIIKWCSSMQQLNDSEKRVILENKHDVKCLNIADGGIGGKTWSPKGTHLSDEAKKHLSEIQKGKKLSEECKRKLSIKMKGRKIEWSDKISERAKERWANPEFKKKMKKSLKGRALPPITEETRKKLSLAQKKVKHTEEWNQKVGNANKGRKWFTNGKENVFSFERPEGFTFGMTRNINKTKEFYGK